MYHHLASRAVRGAAIQGLACHRTAYRLRGRGAPSVTDLTV